jgi:hypothetical protein
VLIGAPACAGFALVSIFNVLMILALGFVDEEAGSKIAMPQQQRPGFSAVRQNSMQRQNSAYSNHSCGANGTT